MGTTAQDVVNQARPLLGDVNTKTTQGDSDLTWDDASLASLMPSAMGMTVDHWPQEYSCGSDLASELSPDPASFGDVAAVSAFLAKTALLSEQGKWARRAVVHSGVGGSTNMRLIAESISNMLDRVADILETAYNQRIQESVASGMTVREAKTETVDSDQARPAVTMVVSA